MSRLFYQVMQDNVGNLLFDVSGTMRLAGSGTLATIYGDEALTAILPNPMTNHPSFGSFKCFLGAGDYDFYMAKSGYTFETLTGVQGHGTMAQQNADAVAITGGTLLGVSKVRVTDSTGNDLIGLRTEVMTPGGTNRWNLYCEGTAPNYIKGRLGLNAFPPTAQLEVLGDPTIGAAVRINWYKDLQAGIVLRAVTSDVASGATMTFANVAGTAVGSITQNASSTAYNTSSDARLKTDVAPLAGAVDVVRALRPVSFLWKADDSPGVGFLAGEVQQVVDGVVSGAPEAVDAEGQIVPQQIDHSKLVPWLTAGMQALLSQVETLQAQVSALQARVA